jgi:hypothetical protein
VGGQQPKTPKKLMPIMPDDETSRVLEQCTGHGFAALRDEAVIRLCSVEGVPGQRLECAGVVDGDAGAALGAEVVRGREQLERGDHGQADPTDAIKSPFFDALSG